MMPVAVNDYLMQIRLKTGEIKGRKKKKKKKMAQLPEGDYIIKMIVRPDRMSRTQMFVAVQCLAKMLYC